MKAHVELTVFIYATDEILKGDIDRLTETFKVYLEAIGGVPQMDYVVNGDVICITAFSSPGTSKGLALKVMYIKKVILDALTEAGMKVPE